MLFSQIPGQQRAKNGLLSLYRANKLPHALLVSGKEGLGGLPLAIAFAQYLVCKDKQGNDACGQCPSCVKMAKLAHPDVHFSFPMVALKPGQKLLSGTFMREFREFVQEHPFGTTFEWMQALGVENKQGNISADECREMINNLNLKAFEDGYKIQIIWRPEYLGKEGNILLKLIEEPPAQTVIILVAEEADRILNTILSRTQIVQLAPLSESEIAAQLMKSEGIAEPLALQTAKIAEGSYATALSLLHDTQNDLFPVLRDWFNLLFTANGTGMVKWVGDRDKTGRESVKNFLLYVLQIISDTMRMSVSPGYQPALRPEEATFAAKLAKRNYAPEVYAAMGNAISEAIAAIGRNANGKVALMALCIQMQHLAKGVPLPVQ